MLKINKYLLSVFLFIGVIGAMAQKPAWTDYYNRTEMFPDKEYLVGFMSGDNTNDEDPGKLKTVYEILAKNKLIQSIQVQIESNTSLNISNVNGKSDEELLSKSVSFSNVNVSGLVIKSYYDRRKKEVFAIAFANKKELLHYYRNIIKSGISTVRQKIDEGKKYANSGKKEPALKSFYDAMPYMVKIDEARALLLALNRKIYIEVNNDEIKHLSWELNDEISKLLEPKNLTLSEAAYFVAYGLFLQIGELKDDFYISEFSYENTGLTSDFSNKLTDEISSSLINIGDYRQKTGNIGLPGLIVSGNYWVEGDMIKISTLARINDKLIASSKGSLPVSVIEKNKINYVPFQIQQLNALNDYSLEVVDFPKNITSGVSSEKPVSIKVSINNEISGKTLSGFPVIVYNINNDDILSKAITNSDGEANCYIGETELQTEILRAAVMPDLASFLDIDYNSDYFLIAKKQNPVAPVIMDIKVSKPEVFIAGNEMVEGKVLEISILEPLVKKVLSDNGYGFVDTPENADYLIEINSNAVSGGQYQGIYFSFLDVNLSIKDQKRNLEVYKNSIIQLKGGGSNRVKAAKKAYSMSSEKIENIIHESPLIKKP